MLSNVKETTDIKDLILLLCERYDATLEYPEEKHEYKHLLAALYKAVNNPIKVEEVLVPHQLDLFRENY